MARTVAIGKQNFESVISGNYFYIDKTKMIKEWWESGDDVTLITRPRRFGKTLNMSMLECFFSIDYAEKGDLFENLFIFQENVYRTLQGTYPVINLSFANVKDNNFESAKQQICQLIAELYDKYRFLIDIEDFMTPNEIEYYNKVSGDMDSAVASLSLYTLSRHLMKYYGKKVIILLDEYDTPMQESYVHGYWNELVNFTRGIFNATFKTNPYLERAIMTGITRVSKESVFSDLNNLKVVTTTSNEYADCFGFTQEEVFEALTEYGLSEMKQDVKKWYDGFVFGTKSDIYNPWSIINLLDTKKLTTYWANTSSNSLIGKLIQEGGRRTKSLFESLLQGETIKVRIDEQIVYSQLSQGEDAIWSLFLASGYLKVAGYENDDEVLIEGYSPEYELKLTNLEVKIMFHKMIHGWFAETQADYNDFIKALLAGNVKEMNAYMTRVALSTFSYFDTGRTASGPEPERFYHGFVLGLIVDLNGRYQITSNRESGYGRYDVMLEPIKEEDDAIILEFKVQDSEEEVNLKETVQVALAQIEKQKYDTQLIAKGIEEKRIRKYGFAFSGKNVLIG